MAPAIAFYLNSTCYSHGMSVLASTGRLNQFKLLHSAYPGAKSRFFFLKFARQCTLRHQRIHTSATECSSGRKYSIHCNTRPFIATP